MIYCSWRSPARNDVLQGEQTPADQPGADGFVFGLFDVGAIVEAALGSFSPVGIDVSVIAPSSDGGETPVYTRPSPLHAHEAAQPAERSPGDVPLRRRDHRRRQPMEDRLRSAWKAIGRATAPGDRSAVLLAGLLVTGLLVGYLLLLTGRTARVEQLVAERTRELHESEQRFRRLVDNAGDAFFLHDRTGEDSGRQQAGVREPADTRARNCCR